MGLLMLLMLLVSCGRTPDVPPPPESGETADTADTSTPSTSGVGCRDDGLNDRDGTWLPDEEACLSDAPREVMCDQLLDQSGSVWMDPDLRPGDCVTFEWFLRASGWADSSWYQTAWEVYGCEDSGYDVIWLGSIEYGGADSMAWFGSDGELVAFRTYYETTWVCCDGHVEPSKVWGQAITEECGRQLPYDPSHFPTDTGSTP